MVEGLKALACFIGLFKVAAWFMILGEVEPYFFNLKMVEIVLVLTGVQILFVALSGIRFTSKTMIAVELSLLLQGLFILQFPDQALAVAVLELIPFLLVIELR